MSLDLVPSKLAESPETPVLCHFATPEEQLQAMRELAQKRPWTYAWGLKEADFDKAKASMPSANDFGLPESAIIQLVPYLESADGLNPVRRTFRDLWRLARTAYPEYHCTSLVDYRDTFEGLCLMPGIKHCPGLRWETIVLESNLLANPFVVRQVQSAPHAGIMAIAAFQPKVFALIKHAIVLPGYDLKTVLDYDFSLPGEKIPQDKNDLPKGSVLCLSYDNEDPGINLFSQRLHLSADEMVVKNPDFNWFVPSFV